MTSKKDIGFNKNYWDAFYADKHLHVPSQFCVSVATELDKDTVIIELGSGNGRDALYYASRGHLVVATDLSQQAIASCSEAAKDRGLEHTAFLEGDITNDDSVTSIIELARSKAEGNNIAFYSRFIMHSLDDIQELKFLTILSKLMVKGEQVFFEFRSKEDADLEKIHKGHFRRYVDTEQFIRRLDDLGLSTSYRITGKGMAKYKTEDPFVSRVIAVKL